VAVDGRLGGILAWEEEEEDEEEEGLQQINS